MKKSIRRQIATIFIAIVSSVLVISIILNSCFLDDFYVHNKQMNLIRVYNQMNRANKRGALTSQGTIDRLNQEVEVGNLSLVVINNNGQEVMSTTQSPKKTQELYGQLMGYILNQNQGKVKLLRTGANYEIHSASDVMGGGEYIEMWGQLGTDKTFLMRSPVESIRESVSISNEFLIYTTLVMLLIGCIFVWYFAKRITNPILELTRLSKRMANLEFDAKYSSGGQNEIGILGTNFNAMSEKLEQTISELKSANYELRKDIEKKDQIEMMRTEFIGNVSHELKTPIALIQGYAEGLKEGVSEDPQNREYYCDVIIDEANKMNQMVKNLLTLNELEFGEEEIMFERFDVVELVRGIIQSNAILIQQKQVDVQLESSDAVFAWGDEYKVEQVIRNYLSNALHHVKNENKITIQIVSDEVKEKVRVTVFNTGDTIPEEDIEHIWNKFYKVDKAHTREYGGNGIGLSIVKAIMKSFQQEFGVVNYENGVAFWFELDLK